MEPNVESQQRHRLPGTRRRMFHSFFLVCGGKVSWEGDGIKRGMRVSYSNNRNLNSIELRGS